MINITRTIDAIERTQGLAGGKWTRDGYDCTVMALVKAGFTRHDSDLACRLLFLTREQFMMVTRQVLFAHYGIGEQTRRALMAINDNMRCSPQQRRHEVLALLRWLRDAWLPTRSSDFSDDAVALALCERAAAQAATMVMVYAEYNPGFESWLMLGCTPVAPAVDLAPPSVVSPAPLTPDEVDALMSAGEPTLAGISG